MIKLKPSETDIEEESRRLLNAWMLTTLGKYLIAGHRPPAAMTGIACLLIHEFLIIEKTMKVNRADAIKTFAEMYDAVEPWREKADDEG